MLGCVIQGLVLGPPGKELGEGLHACLACLEIDLGGHMTAQGSVLVMLRGLNHMQCPGMNPVWLHALVLENNFIGAGEVVLEVVAKG